MKRKQKYYIHWSEIDGLDVPMIAPSTIPDHMMQSWNETMGCYVLQHRTGGTLVRKKWVYIP